MSVNVLNWTLCLMIFYFKKVVDLVRFIPLLQREGQAYQGTRSDSQLESLHS